MYYRVLAKCGHVGKNNYIKKNFYVIALNGKEAAKLVRNYPRVLHDRKDAIVEVEIISQSLYEKGQNDIKNDMYFHVNNIRDQRILQAVDPEEILDRNDKEIKRTRDVQYKLKKNKIKENDSYNQIELYNNYLMFA